MLCSVASDLGLHCLPITLLRVSRLQWVNDKSNLMGLFVSSPRERERRDSGEIKEKDTEDYGKNK